MSRTIFLSAVTDELRVVRERLAALGTRTKRLHVRHQKDFVQQGVLTLQMLETEVAKSELVIHVLGAQAGKIPPLEQVDALLARHPDFAIRFPEVAAAARQEQVSYTQWEAWLALYLSSPTKPLRLCRYEVVDSRAARDAGQTAHVERLRKLKVYPTECPTENELVDEVVLTLIELKFLSEAEGRSICHLQYSTLGELFIGRETFLDDLHQRFLAARAAGRWPNHAVCGVGGLGKTQVAVEYALKHRYDYTAVLMINGDTPESLRRGLAGMAGVLHSNLDPSLPDPIREQATLDWLRSNPGWLLIVDNADTEAARDEVTGRLAQWADGHVLITARFKQWPRMVEALDLQVLSVDDGARFLLEATDGHRRVTVNEADHAKQLASDDLDGLCLALEQAAAYIAERKISFAEYRLRWAENAKEARTWADKTVMQYHTERDVSTSVATTWLTTFLELTPDEQTLLQMFAWLAPDPIPQGLVDHPELQRQWQAAVFSGTALAARSSETWELEESLLDQLFSGTALAAGPSHEQDQSQPAASVVPLTAHDVNLERALAALRRYSLLGHRPGDPTDSAGRVHRVVQLITRDRLSAEQQRATLIAMLKAINAATPAESDDVRTWPVLEPLRQHLLAITAHADRAGIAEPTTRLLRVMAVLLHAKALFMEAEPLIRRALAIDEQSYGAEHPSVATDLNNLAAVLQATNRQTEAELLIRSAQAIDEQSYGAEHSHIAVHLNNLAQLLKDTNRPAEAEPLMRRALNIVERTLGIEHPSFANCLNNLAQLLKDTNRLAEAEPMMRRAQAIDEHFYGAEHPAVARDLHNLAQLLLDTNRLSEAEPLMRRALAIDEQSYGSDHPEVATDLNNLAVLLQDTNRLAEAEPLMRRALAIDEKSYGAEHPSVATNLNNLAAVLQATNRLAEAEPLMRRALAIAEQSYSAEHPKVASHLNTLATLLQATNRLAEAEPLMRRALAIDEQSYGTFHPTVALRLNNLAMLLKATNRLAEAEPLMRRRVDIVLKFTRETGHEHPHLQTAFSNYAELLTAMGRSETEVDAELRKLQSE